MASFRRTKLAVVAAVLSGTAFLTACQSDDADTKSAGTSTATVAATAPAASGQPAPAGDAATAGGRPAADATASGKGGAVQSGTTGDSAGAPASGGTARPPVVEDLDNGKGVDGTWFGNVRYLAPGKYTVSDMKGVEQQFFLATDTEIWGAGEICGDAEGQSATKCTEAQLETATRGTGVSAEVVIKNGIATKITEDH